MTNKPTQQKKVPEIPRELLDFIIWSLRVLWKAAVLFFSGAGEGFQGTRKWLNSKDGAVFLCVLTLTLLLSGFSVIDAIRLYEPPETMVERARPIIDTDVPDPVLVELDSQRLKLSDIIEYAHQAGRLPLDETLTVEEVFERGIVNEAVDQLLLARAAAAEDAVMSSDGVLTKLNIARNRILSAAYLQEVIQQGATEENAVRIYQSQRENISFGDELRLRHILVAEQSLADSIKVGLDQGADFRQVARDISIDTASAERDGDLGYLAYEQMPAGYADQAYGLQRGQISEPFLTEEGWVILRVEGRRPVKPPSYDDVKEDIFEFLKLQAIEQKLATLRKDAEIITYEPGETPEETDTSERQFRQ